jgi:hypothetical protein
MDSTWKMAKLFQAKDDKKEGLGESVTGGGRRVAGEMIYKRVGVVYDLDLLSCYMWCSSRAVPTRAHERSRFWVEVA